MAWPVEITGGMAWPVEITGGMVWPVEITGGMAWPVEITGGMAWPVETFLPLLNTLFWNSLYTLYEFLQANSEFAVKVVQISPAARGCD